MNFTFLLFPFTPLSNILGAFAVWHEQFGRNVGLILPASLTVKPLVHSSAASASVRPNDHDIPIPRSLDPFCGDILRHPCNTHRKPKIFVDATNTSPRATPTSSSGFSLPANIAQCLAGSFILSPHSRIQFATNESPHSREHCHGGRVPLCNTLVFHIRFKRIITNHFPFDVDCDRCLVGLERTNISQRLRLWSRLGLSPLLRLPLDFIECVLSNERK